MSAGIKISISIVSHGQASLVVSLLNDIENAGFADIEAILTLNIDEILPFDPERFSFPIRLLCNAVAKGFSANHNAACAVAKGRFFCVLNPDIRFSNNPFPALLDCFSEGRIGIAAPLVVNAAGEIEDSARNFPSPASIGAKALWRKPIPDYQICGETISPDWVAGMFMLLNTEVFRDIGGFDEQRYFLYYEDVDLCARLRLAGYDIRLCPKAKVVHDARRQSHREWKFRRRHIVSALRFFTSPVYFSLLWARWAKKAATNPDSGRR